MLKQIGEDRIPFDSTTIKKDIKEFYNLYKNRPIKDNAGGMLSAHLFNTWYALKILKPKLVIESGVWKGLGTWIIETAVPDAKVISIEIDYSHLQYKSKNVVYLDKDLASYDWEKIFDKNYPDLDKNEIVVFLDDHQDFLQRLDFIYNLGVKHVLYEDNYPPSQGDTFSPKKILACQDYIMDYGDQRSIHKFSYFDYERFMEQVETYQELPPIFKSEKTRWGDRWDDLNYPTKKQILSIQEKQNFPVFFEEANSYTWICYIGLKK